MRINKERLNIVAKEENAEESAIAADVRQNGPLYKASMRIAMKIKRALKEKNFTQTALSKAMEIDPAVLSRLLNGKANMELKTIVKFEEVLGINIIDRSIPKASSAPTSAASYFYVIEIQQDSLWACEPEVEYGRK